MGQINFIGIAGAIGSGKDTVGKMIQYLTLDKRELATKKIRTNIEDDISAGDTWFDFVPSSSYHISWKIKKWAGKLKEVAALTTGVSIEKFEDQEFKKSFMPSEWNVYHVCERTPNHPSDSHGPIITTFKDRSVAERAVVNLGKDYVVVEEPMTYRTFLQKIGTEGMRNGVHENFWVNATLADYPFGKYRTDYKRFDGEWVYGVAESSVAGGTEKRQVYQRWLLTDTRFPNEAQAIKDHDGIVIRVVREEAEKNRGTHPSETSLDDWDYDYVIHNNENMETLLIEVKKMLTHFGIL